MIDKMAEVAQFRELPIMLGYFVDEGNQLVPFRL
jgi:hypothetical protein